MARILAVDWDTQEVRFLLATIGGNAMKVETAGSAPLAVSGAAGKPSKPDLGQSLHNALAGVKLGRVTVVAGMDRASVEMLQLTLPPAKDSELPELVLNQAMRESQTVGEDSALDFLAANADPAQPRKVTAAALSADQLQHVMAAFAAVKLKPSRLVLRPYAAAALFARVAPPEPGARLLVNLIGDEADLTLVVEKQVAFLRTVRLPSAAEEEKRAQRLLAEIQRTLTVAMVGDLEKEGLREVCVFGAPGDHASILPRITAELGLTATLRNPFDAAPMPAERLPENPGRFAALLGMAIDEGLGQAPAIDFLRPQRRPRPHGRRRNLILAAVAALVVVAVGGLLVWDKVSAAETENQQLDGELRNLKSLLKKASEQKQLVAAVHEWQSSDICWLDELRDLSLRLPTARDMMVLSMAITAAQRSGGEVNLKWLVRDPLIVFRMENDLRDSVHEVRSKREQERVHEKVYTWQVETSMSVSRRERAQYVHHPSDPGAAPTMAPAAAAEKPAEASSVQSPTESTVTRRIPREQVP
jgi:hypothetical protein